MALSKESTFDFEVKGKYKTIHAREKVSIIEDGKEISYKYIRRTIEPDADISNESDEVKGLVDLFWTDELKTAFKNSLTED